MYIWEIYAETKIIFERMCKEKNIEIEQIEVCSSASKGFSFNILLIIYKLKSKKYYRHNVMRIPRIIKDSYLEYIIEQKHKKNG